MLSSFREVLRFLSLRDCLTVGLCYCTRRVRYPATGLTRIPATPYTGVETCERVHHYSTSLPVQLLLALLEDGVHPVCTSSHWR